MQNCVSILEGALQLLTKLNTFFPNDLSVHMNVMKASFIIAKKLEATKKSFRR